jgi:hypothetical protein
MPEVDAHDDEEFAKHGKANDVWIRAAAHRNLRWKKCHFRNEIGTGPRAASPAPTVLVEDAGNRAMICARVDASLVGQRTLGFSARHPLGAQL